MEKVFKFATIEQARNAAIKWMEERKVVFGPQRKIAIGRLGDMKGKETGTESNQGQFWRIRLDFDPQKGAHFNAEIGKGAKAEKAAFCFSGGQQLVQTISKKRSPR